VQVYAEVLDEVRAHNAIFFYGNRMYAIGASPAARTDEATYARFLSSFELLDQAKAREQH